ncbi:collagen alpha-1(I) chain-like isoform X1 [Motacilla alba alba]|uniref:collagen alpha-1(I) chain-like isoform X1 n=1 Tax=Motacilla alba alba TaxID=1094192 RepID=UPI0018D56F40|nr:collagen alpha-1(I) chain-like isoform X1 [Motacilla alba alba]
METARLCLLCLLGSGLILLGTPEPAPELRPTPSLPGHGRELVGVLREVLAELGTREPPALQKRLSWVPWVRRGGGAALAVRGGPQTPLRRGCGPGADGATRSASPGSRAPCGAGRASGSSAAAPAAPPATSSSSSAPEGAGTPGDSGGHQLPPGPGGAGRGSRGPQPPPRSGVDPRSAGRAPGRIKPLDPRLPPAFWGSFEVPSPRCRWAGS